MRPCHFLLAAMLAGASLALVFAPAPVWASTPVDWGIGVQSCPAATNAGYDQYMVRPGASFHCTIGAAQSSGTTQTVDVLAVQGVQSPNGGMVSPNPGTRVQFPFVAVQAGVRVPTGPTPVKAPFTVSVPAKTAPGDYFGYLAIVNPSPTCPSGATTCVKIESQVASPFTLIVANPDGSAPAPNDIPLGISRVLAFNQGATKCATVSGTAQCGYEVSASVQNTGLGAAPVSFITLVQGATSLVLGPNTLGTVLSHLTLPSITVGAAYTQTPIPRGTYKYNECVSPSATSRPAPPTCRTGTLVY